MRTFLLLLLLLAFAGTAQAQQGAAVTSIVPTFGPAGTVVAIRGSGLAGAEAGSTWAKGVANEPPPGFVDFNGVPAEILFWQDDLITVRVPKGASSGPVRVIIPRNSILATESFDVYYSTPDDRTFRRPAPGDSSRFSDDSQRTSEREPRWRFDDANQPSLFVNPWFSGLRPGERTFLAEQSFGGSVFFGDSFMFGRGRSSLFGDDGFRGSFGNRRFGFANPFFSSFLFRGSRRSGIGPFWFRFR